ncbi:hypothetical protein PIB30_068539 [Stylosanthes scabra]|uniref:RING-type E3 ubiquitin transferase n=1 Tax=Stylosanthes scabra TaxID=79078 RepID=A0ABU6WMU6_9FABA|nr:hypothetical protein [Stylosanthes scabra]
MDDYSGKRAIDGVVVPRKGMGHLFRDSANTRDRNGQVCSRLGCSSKVNSTKGSQIGSSEKGKSLRTFRATSGGKEAIGSSSRTFTGNNNSGKSHTKPRKTLSSQLETDSSETSSVHDEPEVVSPPENFRRVPQAEVENVGSSCVVQMEVGSSSVASSNTGSRRNFHPKPGLRGQETKSAVAATRPGTSRYGLRNLRCNSISDVVPAGFPPTDSANNRRKDTVKKRNCEGESSSTARGKKINGSSLEVRNSGPRNGISISDSRRPRNTPSNNRDRPDSNLMSVRTRRPTNGNGRGRLSNQSNANPVASNEPVVMIPTLPHSGDHNAPGGVLHLTSLESPLSRPDSYSRPGSSSDELYGIMPMSPTEYGITHSLINRDSFRRRSNMDGIAEQILLLESNLLLTGLNFYDQHRDMRLDIDNMSYEELLALEERMGSVSTALTEEALSECLKRSIFQSLPSVDVTETCNGNKNKDDTKCSICQEEYMVGDEVGNLQCQHMYHVVCIQQWLRLKNWCPICKSSVAKSSTPSLPPSSSPSSH